MHWLPIHLSPICISFICFFHALSFICFPMRNKQWNACATSLWFCFSFYCFCAFFFPQNSLLLLLVLLLADGRIFICVCPCACAIRAPPEQYSFIAFDRRRLTVCQSIFVCNLFVFFCCWSNNVCECTILLITVWQEQQQQKHTHTNNNNKKWKRIIFISVWFGSRLHSVSHIILIFPLNTTNWIITRPLCIIAKQWNDR